MSAEINLQYPEIMVGKKIMYVHGFGSSAQSGTISRLRRFLPQTDIIAEDIPLVPTEAMAMLQAMAERERPDLIIGTSMGGMYTEMLHGFDRILVNPAFQMGETMAEHGMMGKQTFFNPRKDGQQEFIVTKALVKEYKAMTEQCFGEIEADRVWGLFGDNDPLVHTYDLFLEHYPHAIRFHGEHRLNDSVLIDYLIPLIRQIDDRQERRQRPTVVIDFECLHDDYGHATSSMRKAYYALIEHYKVNILAPAPSTNPSAMPQVMAWVEQYLSAPAHDSVIFTNQPQLLMADYLITKRPFDGFIGTHIAFGSPEMKTWEDIIIYFDRLGGQ